MNTTREATGLGAFVDWLIAPPRQPRRPFVVGLTFLFLIVAVGSLLATVAGCVMYFLNNATGGSERGWVAGVAAGAFLYWVARWAGD